MHKYLRAIGFSQFDTRKKIQTLLKACVLDSSKRSYTTNSDDTMLAEYCKDFAPNIGISVCGEMDENNNFIYDYYFPYVKPSKVSTGEDVSIERHASKESYAGICDDPRMGVSLIFYLQNMIDYVRMRNEDRIPMYGTSLSLSALSTEGMVLMPINKNERQKETIRKRENQRIRLIQAARKGDEKAMEILTIDDMDTYNNISRVIQKKDVFSIVDSYFMPYGVECDQYSILGEILDYEMITNSITQEKLYLFHLNCNEINMDVCINEKDFYGEPKIGRRFKGVVWLQGYINFP